MHIPYKTGTIQADGHAGYDEVAERNEATIQKAYDELKKRVSIYSAL